MKQLKTILLTAAFCLIGFMMTGMPAAAAEKRGDVLILPVGQIVNVNGASQIPEDTFTYTLTAETTDTPMPDSAQDGDYTFHLTGTTRSRISIAYPHAGAWHYTLKPASDCQDSAYQLDATIYKVDVYAQNADNGSLHIMAIVSNAATGEKTDGIEFVNTYAAAQPKPENGQPGNLNTGLEGHLGMSLLAAGLMVIAIGAAIKLYHSKHR